LTQTLNEEKDYKFGGNGIANMYQRAKEIKGKLCLNAEENGGTEINFELNL